MSVEYKVTIFSGMPNNTCHTGKKVVCDLLNQVGPAWTCAECGNVLEKIQPQQMKVEPM